jgi:LacI family transcriptional regulator
MADLPRVALIIETSGTYGRQILRGITQYIKSHRPWSVFFAWQHAHAATPWFRRVPWNGAICRSTDRRWIPTLRRRGIPAIFLGQRNARSPGVPRIWSDNRAIGRMGAEHLLERGFRQFAFCGFADEAWAAERRDGFMEAIQAAGYPCALCESAVAGTHAPNWSREQTAIARWIGGLPKPMGLMACSDARGQEVLNACRMAGTVVPEEVAVLGVDNDELLCDLCDPPLSSIALNPERVGCEAAELLDHLMRGGKPPAAERWIPPRSVVVRQSTDVLGIEDKEINAAVRFIREKACDGVTVGDVAAHLSLSRSTLERRFRGCLGRSPHAQILLARIKRVEQLLSETDLPLETIAKLTGYSHPEYLGVVFKRMTGQTIKDRRSNAGDPPTASGHGGRRRRRTSNNVTER